MSKRWFTSMTVDSQLGTIFQAFSQGTPEARLIASGLPAHVAQEIVRLHNDAMDRAEQPRDSKAESLNWHCPVHGDQVVTIPQLLTTAHSIYGSCPACREEAIGKPADRLKDIIGSVDSTSVLKKEEEPGAVNKRAWNPLRGSMGASLRTTAERGSCVICGRPATASLRIRICEGHVEKTEPQD